MTQLSLFDYPIDEWTVKQFSANGFCCDKARIALEEKFIKLTSVTDEYNRQSVSFQLSKKDSVHRWLKYKEGFSADLVMKLLKEMGIKDGDTVLDPFMGSGTTSLVCKFNNINSIGFDILPMTKISIKAKDAIMDYDIEELDRMYDAFVNSSTPKDYKGKFSYISITDSAFPDETEKDVVYYTEWINKSDYSEISKNLFVLCIINSLESISYTRKDGQYLAWDSRSRKIIEANKARAARGAKPIDRLNKGEIPSFHTALENELQNVITDIKSLQNEGEVGNGKIHYEEGSSLLNLPKLNSQIIEGVVTSPPYCNRYDYTRTYALEMNYLGLSSAEITKLRQSLVSCTVENKSKVDFLKEYYASIGKAEDYDRIINIYHSTDALNEIREALQIRQDNGEINNKGVLRMVDGYFTDLTFIYAEIYRLLKDGGSIAVVNDNVRYAGEVIPVDFISSEIAEKIGFKVKKIYTLKQKKGNSSQQMAKYGRVALRKSITIWQK